MTILHQHNIPQHNHGYSHYHSAGSSHGCTVTVEEDLDPNIEIDFDCGYYTAFKKDKHTGLNEEVFLPEPYPGEEPLLYSVMLTADQLVALSKILYERWTFVSGDSIDKAFYKACEGELKNRRESSPYLTHQHMPVHSHNIGYVSSGVCGSNGSHTHTFRSANPHGQIVDLPYHPSQPPRQHWRISAS